MIDVILNIAEGSLMRKSIISIVILFIVQCCFSTKSHALGIGLYTRGSSSISNMHFKPDKDGGVDYILGAGALLDTAVARNKFFNYRLYLGYDTVMNSGGRLFDAFNMHRVVLSNTFGFAVFANKFIRVWLGPALSLQIQYGNGKYSSYEYSIFFYEARHYHRKSTIYILDFGIAYGINMHVSDRISLGLDIDITGGIGLGPDRMSIRSFTIARDLWGETLGYMPYAKTNSNSKEFARVETTAKVCVIYRVGDEYSAEGVKE